MNGRRDADAGVPWKFGIPFLSPIFAFDFYSNRIFNFRSLDRSLNETSETGEGFSKFQEGRERVLFFFFFFVNTFVTNFEFEIQIFVSLHRTKKRARSEFFFFSEISLKGKRNPVFSAILENLMSLISSTNFIIRKRERKEKARERRFLKISEGGE